MRFRRYRKHARNWFTSLGTPFTYFKNGTTANSICGMVFSLSTNEARAYVYPNTLRKLKGMVCEDGIPPGEQTKVVIRGICDAMLEDGDSAEVGYPIQASTVWGRVTVSTNIEVSIVSWAQASLVIGRCLETKAAGTDVICRVLFDGNI